MFDLSVTIDKMGYISETYFEQRRFTMPIYNKLVRDLVPQVIERSNKKCNIRILNDEEFISELHKKLHEEMKEYLSCQTKKEALEELADLLEILHTLTEYHGFNVDELEATRLQKAQERGGFKEKIFLINVEDVQHDF